MVAVVVAAEVVAEVVAAVVVAEVVAAEVEPLLSSCLYDRQYQYYAGNDS